MVDLRRADVAELAVTWLAEVVAAVFVGMVALQLDAPVNHSSKLREHDADETVWQMCDQCIKVPVEGLRRDELVLEDVVDEDDLDVVLVVITVVLVFDDFEGGN